MDSTAAALNKFGKHSITKTVLLCSVSGFFSSSPSSGTISTFVPGSLCAHHTSTPHLRTGPSTRCSILGRQTTARLGKGGGGVAGLSRVTREHHDNITTGHCLQRGTRLRILTRSPPLFLGWEGGPWSQSSSESWVSTSAQKSVGKRRRKFSFSSSVPRATPVNDPKHPFCLS